MRKEYIITSVSLTALLIHYFVRNFYTFQLISITTIILSVPFLWSILKEMFKGHFGVDIIALVAIVAAFAIGEREAALIVLLMLSGGASLERYAEGKARSALQRLLLSVPTVAHRFKNHALKAMEHKKDENIVLEDVPVQDIQIGNMILVQKGEVVPVDGVVIDGVSTLDESMITGEPLPRSVRAGSQIKSGTINMDQALHVEVLSTHENSAFAAIIRLVRDAENKKAPLVRAADDFSLFFTAVTFLLAGIAYFIDPKIAVAVLVVATPCPLIIAAPVAFIAGMSRTARKGIIVKHGGVFEYIVHAKTFLFDKTGTLTFGTPKVSRVHVYHHGKEPKDAVSNGDAATSNLVYLAASVEQYSSHVLGRSLVKYAQEAHVELSLPEDFKEELGNGATGKINNKIIAVGKLDYVTTTLSPHAKTDHERAVKDGNMIVFVSIDGLLSGSIVFEDTVRPETKSVLAYIRKQEIDTVLVTGDFAIRANRVGSELGFTSVEASCLPSKKVDVVNIFKEKYKNQSSKRIVMIGDGINDAPALATADVGITLGSHGATASTDTSNVIIAEDSISKIVDLIDISNHTTRVAYQSIYIGIGLSITAMIVAMFGLITPVQGALLQEVIDIVAILNALRALA